MKIFVYSYFEPDAEVAIGGAQYMMQILLNGILKKGHKIVYICPKSQLRANKQLSHKNLDIHPVINNSENSSSFLHLEFENRRQIEMLSRGADVFWGFDRILPFPLSIPVVLTLATVAYQIESHALMSLSWDVLLLASPYLRRLIEPIVGENCWIGKTPPIVTAPHAIDIKKFTHTSSRSLIKILDLPKNKKFLLFPHRPDPNKGFEIAIETIDRLIKHDTNFALLIPKNLTYKEDIEYYSKLHKKVQRMKLSNHILFHDWVSASNLPAYFSLGTASLALGVLPEGFGLTPVQSIACGTPVISTRAGALGDLFPSNHGVIFVGFNKTDEVVDAILNLPDQDAIRRGVKYIHKIYDVDRLVSTHIEWFMKASKKKAYHTTQNTNLQVSPWCRIIDQETIWHDFKMSSYKLNEKQKKLIQAVLSRDTNCFKNFQREIAVLKNKGILIGNN